MYVVWKLCPIVLVLLINLMKTVELRLYIIPVWKLWWLISYLISNTRTKEVWLNWSVNKFYFRQVKDEKIWIRFTKLLPSFNFSTDIAKIRIKITELISSGSLPEDSLNPPLGTVHSA